MKTIDELWKKLKDVELVQVRPVEMEAMYKHCFEFEKPLIVEIGSAHGASSIILAEAASELKGKLICIDSYLENYYNQEKFGMYAKEAFLKNVFHKYPRETVELWTMTSSVAAHKRVSGGLGEISVLFIDGDHDYDGVRADCFNWLPKLRKGGYVGFHDYNNPAFKVKKAVDEITGIKKVGSYWDLAVYKKV